MEMEYIISFASIIGAALSIILFFKVWGMCNNVGEIKKQLRGTNAVTTDELVYLHKIGDPSFPNALKRTIYEDLLAQTKRSLSEAWYASRFKMWRETCEANEWDFPTIFAEADTSAKFKEIFSPKSR